MDRKIVLLLTLSFFINACQVDNHSKSKKDTPQTDEYSKSKEIIRSLDTIVNPNGIQEYFQTNIGGIEQSVYVRGQNKNNPIIIFVHGGPASPMAPLAWAFQRPFEEYFTIVQYDQRAAGKTFLKNDTVNLGNTLTIDQYANDLIQLTDFIRKKYNKRKVILLGHSWGTIVSMTAVLKRPDLFYAYVGVGQVINAMDNERISFEYALKEAQKRHDTIAFAELQAIAPYPGNLPLTVKRVLVARKWAQYYGGLAAYRNNTDYYFMLPLLSPVYSKSDVDGITKGIDFTLPILLPKLLSVDFKPIKKFPIPIFMFMGRHDYTTPSEPTSEWINQVKAPIKEGVWFENSAHLIPIEEPGKMLITLVNRVRPLAEIK
ncbi:MAG TPA: alpha/beta hydrolase [Williamwhitmania sp.]|nr:alpha/beta hydrolase [Williamwhitmania sp.]